MKIKKLSKSDYLTTEWSGGTTSQITIYPKNANVREKNFIYRISSAVVKVDSTFTKYSGFTRYITTLDNNIVLNNKNLNPLQIHKFSGDDETSSVGNCIDFNLICNENYECNMEIKSHDFSYYANKFNHFTIFSLSDMEININNNNFYLKKYDSIVVEDCDILDCKFSNNVIVAMIKL